MSIRVHGYSYGDYPNVTKRLAGGLDLVISLVALWASRPWRRIRRMLLGRHEAFGACGFAMQATVGWPG
jgi:hypothetical protein